MNYEAVEHGVNSLVKIEVPSSWSSAVDKAVAKAEDEPDFVKNVLRPMNAQKGDNLPVSTFSDTPDGVFPLGTSKFEKRGVAVNVPEWDGDNCIQCNQCSYVCPHAAIRPFLLDEKEVKNAPESFKTIKAIGRDFEGLQYRIQVSPLDCVGCGNCVDICPSKQNYYNEAGCTTDRSTKRKLGICSNSFRQIISYKQIHSKGQSILPTTV